MALGGGRGSGRLGVSVTDRLTSGCGVLRVGFICVCTSDMSVVSTNMFVCAHVSSVVAVTFFEYLEKIVLYCSKKNNN